MDKNTLTGMTLIFALAMTYVYFFTEPPIPQENIPLTEEVGTVDDNTLESQSALTTLMDTMPDSTRTALLENRITDEFGDFANAAQGENKVIKIETGKYQINLSTKGGAISEVILNDFRTYSKKPLPILTSNEDNEFYLEFTTLGDRVRNISTKDLYFLPDTDKDVIKVGEGQTTVLNLKAEVDKNRYLLFRYTFFHDKYDVDFDVEFIELDRILKNKAFELHWTNVSPVTERSYEVQRQKSGIYYKEGDEVEDMLSRSAEDQVLDEPVQGAKWVGYSSQFFTNTLLGDKEKGFTILSAKSSVPASDSINRINTTLISVPIGAGNMHWYMGPLEVAELRKFGRDMSQQIDFGYSFLNWINQKPMYWIFKGLEKLTSNYGLIIFLLAFLIKMLIYPMTFKMYQSQAKMRIINDTPEIKSLEAKFKDDPTKLSQEKMSFYKQFGVSPFGGCLPMLLQWPFLISLFFFFPALIELRQVPFLWAEDLSSYDSVMTLPFEIPWYGSHVSLFTLLMAISVFIYSMINMKIQGNTAANPMMKFLPYFSPILMLFFLNKYSSGLSFYYFVANIITIAQTTLTKYFMDDTALLSQIEEYKKKGKNKRKGKGRVEKWLEDQQRKQKQGQPKQKKPKR